MTSIEWTQQTWNPIAGCSRVSEGCKNCYAEVMTRRLQAMGQPKYQGLLNEHGRFNGKVRFDETALLAPLKRKKPTTYFVNSMSDLFHENVPDEWIDKVFAVMALCPQHPFQVLSKRSERLRDWVNNAETRFRIAEEVTNLTRIVRGVVGGASWAIELLDSGVLGDLGYKDFVKLWPLPNVHLGVSTENQEQADARIPHLLETPAAVRFVSAEPLLGEISLSWLKATLRRSNGIDALGGLCFDGGERDDNGHFMYDGAITECSKINWVIVGGESGPNARKCNIDWIRSVVNQCKAAEVPVFVKQMGADVWADEDPYRDSRNIQSGTPCALGCLLFKDKKGGNPEEWPEDLRVRMMPGEVW